MNFLLLEITKMDISLHLIAKNFASIRNTRTLTVHTGAQNSYPSPSIGWRGANSAYPSGASGSRGEAG